jgi:peptidoglycan/LPS O-acetylase OafA/YrhL
VGAGWIGVDLFFVLSGFLITGILLDAKGGRAFFRSFYARRALRIFPLYIALVLLAIVVAPAWRSLTTPAEAATLRANQWWYWTYTVNIMIAMRGWPSAAWNTGPLWSLSVEEQFYLLWPAIVFFVSRRTLVRVSLGVMIGAALARLLFVALAGPVAGIYVLLPTRIDALTMGALLAAGSRDPIAWARLRAYRRSVAIGAVVVLFAVFRLDALDHEGAWTQTVGFPALAALGAVAIVSAIGAAPGTLAGWLWSRASLQALGKYSYGIYGWHPFAIALVRERILPQTIRPVPLTRLERRAAD